MGNGAWSVRWWTWALLFAGLLPAQGAPVWQLVDGPVPPAYGGHYDARRASVVRFFEQGGVYEGTARGWRHVAVTATPPDAPVGRTDPAVAFDPERGRLVLFGGQGASSLGDTWSWDGLRWQRIVTVVSPPRRAGGAMAFDTARGVMVLCGGTERAGILVTPLADTWELVGEQWRSLRNTPGYGADPVMAYDAARGDMVLVATGAFHFDGAAWRYGNRQVVATAAGAMAYDPIRRVVVLHRAGMPILEYDGTNWRTAAASGSQSSLPALHFDPDLGTVVLSEHDGRARWSWNGTTAAALPLPQPSWGAGTVSFVDVQRGEMVVVGSGSGVPMETWTQSGIDWTRRQPTRQPGPVSGNQAAFDTLRGQGLVYDDSGAFWAWNGSDWLPLAGGPGPRRSAHLVHDPVRDRAVLTGGTSTTTLTDTWEWDGTSWTLATTFGPALHLLAAVAFDRNRGRPIAVDSLVQPPVTREWDGVQWRVVPGAVPPFGLASMTFAPRRGRTVMVHAAGEWEFDGAAWTQVSALPAPFTGLSDLHEHPTRGTLVLVGRDGVRELAAEAAAVEVLGAACGTPTAVLMNSGVPRLGRAAFALTAASTPAAATVLALDTASAAVALGNGCNLHLAAPLVVLLTAADGRGLATLPLPIVSAAGLLGLDVFAQAAATSVVQPGGFVTTQALRLHIGP